MPGVHSAGCRSLLSVERPIPWHVAEGREGDRGVALRLRPRADTGEQAGPEPAPAMLRQDIHLLDVRGSLPYRGDHHAHEEAVLLAAYPDLPHADEAGQVVQGKRHVERLMDEPEAREDRARLILDLLQARDLVRAGEANPVGICLLVHGVVLGPSLTARASCEGSERACPADRAAIGRSSGTRDARRNAGRGRSAR